MATHSSILAWRIPWTEEPGGLLESDMTERLHFHFSISDQTQSNQASGFSYQFAENTRDREPY